MRIVFLFLALTTLVACGNGGSGSGGSGSNEGAQQQEVYDAVEDGLGWDGLEAVIEVPALVSASEVTFRASKTDRKNGMRISCQLSVTSGESYQYAVSGDTLWLTTPEGNMQFERTSAGSGTDISGLWEWFGELPDRTLLHTTFYVSPNKQMVTMRKNCEK